MATRTLSWADLRAARNLSLREVEERTHINRGEISRIERGRGCATPEQARKLLAAYDSAAVDIAYERTCRKLDGA